MDNGAIKLQKEAFIKKYEAFIKNINFQKNKLNTEILNALEIKLFRQKENNLKANFILDNSDITPEMLSIANKVSNLNPYHNFGHQLGVAETAIKIAQHQNLSKSEINLLVVASPFHDAQHNVIPDIQAEEKAYETAVQNLPDTMLQELWVEKSDLYHLTIATKLTQHGKIEDQLAKIIQDADLWGLGRWPYYLLYSVMGLLDEGKVNIENFLDFENTFIQKIKGIKKKFSFWMRKKYFIWSWTSIDYYKISTNWSNPKSIYLETRRYYFWWICCSNKRDNWK